MSKNRTYFLTFTIVTTTTPATITTSTPSTSAIPSTTNPFEIFNNPEFGDLRCIEKDGEPWFVGKDVAVALGYEKPTDAVRRRVFEEDRGISKMETPSGTQQMTIINESGLYSLIFRSKLEKAKAFKHWVTSEVLPALRKTGSYTVGSLIRSTIRFSC